MCFCSLRMRLQLLRSLLRSWKLQRMTIRYVSGVKLTFHPYVVFIFRTCDWNELSRKKEKNTLLISESNIRKTLFSVELSLQQDNATTELIERKLFVETTVQWQKSFKL